MAQPPGDKKPDFSSLPRGAIGIKGFPVSRNTRLPSIRSPRDLTLVTIPKKTYMPNIPVRREKKPPISESKTLPKQEDVKFDRKRNSPQLNDRGRGRGRGRAQIIQTTGALFSEGIAQDPLSHKDKFRETYQKSDYSVPRSASVKKEKNYDVGEVNRKMENLFRDDFVDYGDDDDIFVLKPTIFPSTAEIKKESKRESPVKFDPKEVGFDKDGVAKIIKKEKDVDNEEYQHSTSAETSNSETVSLGDKASFTNIKNLINTGTNSPPKLVLLHFPEFVSRKIEDSEHSNKQATNSDPKVSDNQNVNASIKSLPEGYIGKLKVMKSGKAKLVIGSVELNLDNIDLFSSKHEIVSIKTESNAGDLAVLGYLEQKLKFVPDEDSLIS